MAIIDGESFAPKGWLELEGEAGEKHRLDVLCDPDEGLHCLWEIEGKWWL